MDPFTTLYTLFSLQHIYRGSIYHIVYTLFTPAHLPWIHLPHCIHSFHSSTSTVDPFTTLYTLFSLKHIYCGSVYHIVYTLFTPAHLPWIHLPHCIHSFHSSTSTVDPFTTLYTLFSLQHIYRGSIYHIVYTKLS